MSAENLLAEWSRLLFESLADAGLERVIVSPGSRSTPFVWAALQCSRLRCEHVIDERCAAFYALGSAKMSGKPAAVLCTSGSAAANYFPAVVEASLSYTPLLLLTADRPFELMDCGASQTIDQVKLYGDYVRHFVDVGMPEVSDASLYAIRRVASQAVARSIGEPPGPVHINLRARKPLEPQPPKSVEALELTRRVDRILLARAPVTHAPSGTVDERLAADVAQRCRRARSGIIVCGPMNPFERPDPQLVARLSRATGFPVFAEATSGLRYTAASTPHATVDALGSLLGARSFRAGKAPEIALQIGSMPIAGAWETLVQMNADTMTRFLFARHGWPDPIGTASAILQGDISRAVSAVIEALEGSEPRPEVEAYAAELRDANTAAWNLIDEELERPSLTEGAAVRLIVDRLAERSLLCVGNSLPVREVDTFARARAAGIVVWSQRGASGIDGVISGAAGAASAFDGPATLLIGDVSFLHDIGGLHLASRTRCPFTIVVLNNDGGRIFEQLPVANRSDIPRGAIDFWTTPHGLPLESAARLYQVAFTSAGTPAELANALTAAQQRVGCSVVEVRVDPASVQDERRRISERLEDHFSRLGTGNAP